MLVQESKKELERHTQELDKIIAKLEIDFNLSSSKAEREYVQIARGILLKICEEIVFVKNSEALYKNFTYFRRNVITKLDSIRSLVRELDSIANELNNQNTIVNEATIICDFIVIDLFFIICGFVIESKYEAKIRGELESIELTLDLLSFTHRLSSRIKNNFALLVQQNYSKYIYFPVLIAEKILDFKSKIQQDSIAYSVSSKEIDLLNRLKTCREKTSLFTKTIVNCLKDKDIDIDADILIILENTSFRQYESISYVLGNISWCRISYLDKVLKLMSPSRNHEKIYRNIDLLVVEYCDYKEIDYFPMGSSTIKKEGVGKEPDSSYAIGENKDIPDLAIEVNFTSGGIEDLKKYFILGIKEVWMWDKKTLLSFYILDKGDYIKSIESKLLPGLKSEKVQEYLFKLDNGNHRTIKKKFILDISSNTPESSFS